MNCICMQAICSGSNADVHVHRINELTHYLSRIGFHLVSNKRCYYTSALAHMILHYAYSRFYVKRIYN